MKTKYSRLMFIDSEINTVGQHGKCKILIPNHPFSVHGEEKMRLTLLSFEMKRNWYNINQTNNTFYISIPSSNVFEPVQIKPGVYDTFDGGTYIPAAADQDPLMKGLGHALYDSLKYSFASLYASAGYSSLITVESVFYDANTRGYSFKLSVPSGSQFPADLDIVFFQCKSGTQPIGVSDSGFFNDSHEILGGVPTRDSSSIQQGLLKSNSTVVEEEIFTSFFPASLNSLEAIYLRCNIQTQNYQTHGFEKQIPDRNGMTESSIFARLPLDRACFDPIFQFVQFEDTNDLFQINLSQKTLDSLTLSVNDDKGRLLAETHPSQADLGLMNFKCVLRWDAIEGKPKQNIPVSKADSEISQIPTFKIPSLKSKDLFK